MGHCLKNMNLIDAMYAFHKNFRYLGHFSGQLLLLFCHVSTWFEDRIVTVVAIRNG